MRASVDERRQLVCGDGVELPFTLDLRRGVALLQGADRIWRVRPQRWSEKCRLARFAAWGEAFVRKQLWNMCVRPEPVEPAPGEQEALLALAAWLSAGGSHEAALPLDSASLTRVALTVCRQLGIGPAVLDALPAYEVEAMWRQIPNAAGEDEAPSAGAQAFTHRIEVIPDSPPVALSEAGSESSSDLVAPSSIAAPKPSAAQQGKPSKAAAAKPVAAGTGREEKAPRPSIVPMTRDGGKESEEKSPGAVSEQAGVGNPVLQPSGHAHAGDASLALSQPTSGLRALERSPGFMVERKPGRLQAKSRFRVMMPANHDRAAESTLASTPGSSITHHPAIAAIKSDPAVTEQAMPWANRRSPMQTPFLPPAAPAVSLAPSFDDFAAEFSEGLQVAAAELGILEER